MLGRLIDLLLETLWVIWVILAISAVCALPTIYKRRNHATLKELFTEENKNSPRCQIPENISIYSLNKSKTSHNADAKDISGRKNNFDIEKNKLEQVDYI